MELSRRDALAALASVGIGSTAGCAVPVIDDDSGVSASPSPVGDHELATLVAVASVVYPSDVDNVTSFVHIYVSGRIENDTESAQGITAGVEALDDYAREFYDDEYVALSPESRLDVLDYMSVDVAEPAPAGTVAQRVRYHVVNELLYAFYASPTGAKLAGLENPPGHPGGIGSYREGPAE